MTPDPTLTWQSVEAFLNRGGPAMWLIAVLSVLTLALILWKLWRFSAAGAWRRGAAQSAVADWEAGRRDAARAGLAGRGGMRAQVLRAAMGALQNPAMDEAHAREETTRVAKRVLSRARSGLRALELIATIAPLIGLFGTVLGMIEAFQALQEAGTQTDPGVLAGGIWEALLTTAAGMGVAIPASMALSWFESITERVQGDMEDLVTRVFVSGTGA